MANRYALSAAGFLVGVALAALLAVLMAVS